MKQNTKETFKLYFQHARRYRLAGCLVVGALLSASLTSTLVPILYKQFFDVLAGTGSVEQKGAQLMGILTWVAAGITLQWALWRVAEFANSHFQTSVLRDLYQTCFDNLHKHSVQFFHGTFVGSLVKQVNKFVWAFERVADRLTWDLSTLLVRVFTVSVVLAWRNVWLGVAVLAWVMLFAALNYWFSVFKLKYDIERSALATKATGRLADTITNAINVKLFASYERERKSYGELLERFKKKMKFCWDLSSLSYAVMGLLMLILEVGLLYLAIQLWKQGTLTVGDFVLVQTYVVVIVSQVMDFGRIIRDLYEQLAEAEEMTVILNMPHDIQDRKSAPELHVSQPSIEFEDVTFCYNKTRTVIENLNLSIAPGERVALVGPSGAGKSTIIKLLLRLFDASSGKIRIDGQRINRVTQDSLHRAVSLVPQDPILFHRPLIENIRYGRPEATDEEVIEAAKQANCHDFIMAAENGYQTLVGERGVKLSGGERQRVAIARAILRGSPILVLDEATSSLDSESEVLIQEALDRLMRGKTVVSIAHRLSTIMQMDRIIVLEQGRIIEQGAHQELLAQKDGMYRKLWNLQAGGFAA